MPRRFVAALVIWPLLLFAFFLVPEVRYFDAPPLLTTVTLASGQAGQPAPGLQKRSLAVLVLPLESDANEEYDFSQIQRTLQLRERVGTNILSASGYLDEAYFVSGQNGQSRGQSPNLGYHVLKPKPGVVACAMQSETGGGVPLETREHAAYLALAIVAIEKFNRNTMHRFTERTYAKLHRWAFDRLPDLSFGPAQIRLSLIRQVAAERPDWKETAAWASKSDDQLLELIRRECDALRTVATIVQHRIERDHSSDTGLAASYVGQRRRSEAPIDYAHLVEVMTLMMRQPLPEEDEALPLQKAGGQSP